MWLGVGVSDKKAQVKVRGKTRRPQPPLAVIKLENPLELLCTSPCNCKALQPARGDPAAVGVVDSVLYPVQVLSLVCPCALNQSWFHSQAWPKYTEKQDVFAPNVETFGPPMTKLSLQRETLSIGEVY